MTKGLIIPVCVIVVMAAGLAATFFLPASEGAAADVKVITPPSQYEYMKPAWARDVEVHIEDFGRNLALGAAVKGSYTEVYNPENAVDGDVTTYWEGMKRSYPNVFTLILPEAHDIGVLRLRLNPGRIWASREMTFTIYAGGDEDSLTEVVPSNAYPFSPATGNFVEITMPKGLNAAVLKLEFTDNSGAYAGQIAELEVYAPE